MKLSVCAAVVLAGCGSGASFSNLQCQSPCQTREDPWHLKLRVDYSDPSLQLQGGALVVRVDTASLPEIPIAPLAKTGSTAGTVDVDVHVPLRELVDGTTITVGVKAMDHDGLETNEATLAFVMTL